MPFPGGLRGAAAAAAAMLLLSGCSGADDVEPRSLANPVSSTASPTTPTASATTPSSPTPSSSGLPTTALSGDTALSVALLLVPAEAEAVAFTDVEAVKRRLGYPDLTGQSPTYERFEFWERARADGAMLTGTELYDDSSVMSSDYGWTAEDVAWEVAWSTDAASCTSTEDCAGSGYVLGLRRDLDWNVIVNSLTDNGFAESDETRGLYATKSEKAPFAEVRMLPEIHGLAVGDVALPSGDDPDPRSKADVLAPLAIRLLAHLGDPESAYLRTACVELETALGPAASEDDMRGYFRTHDPSALRPPLNTAFGLDGRGGATVVLEYAEDDAARADAAPREDVINTWTGLQTGVPFAEVGSARVEAESGYGVVRITGARLAVLTRMVLTDDAPWALCPASPPPK